MSEVLQRFTPSFNNGVTVSPGVSSAATTIGKGNTTLCLTNTGSNICYIKVADSSAVATAADFPVLGGTQKYISISSNHVSVAYISAAGTTLNIMPGVGF